MKASDYGNANVVYVTHEALNHKQNCLQELCTGKVYRVTQKAGGVIRIIGHAPFSATRYIQEKFRCNLCSITYTAKLPAEAGDDKYTVQAKSVLCVNKYYLGMPFYRIETYQKMVQVPFPDATQWDIVESVAGCLIPLFKHMEDYAAQGDILHNDDTTVKIVALIMAAKLSENDKERKGMYTTGIVSKVGENNIYLFYSGQQHAGENLDDVLENRDPDLPIPLQMSDGLAANKPKKAKTKEGNCLVHGRRKFAEIYDHFPKECGYVIEQIALIYKHESYCKEQGLDKFARLLYHQTHSRPVMAELKAWLDKQIIEKRVEPNSHLGNAIKYMRKRWPKLTLFLREAGAAIDNNIVERALKIMIRQRKSSMFYKTVYSAFIGSMITSIIYTCVMANENPIEYLNALQNHRMDILRNPHDWLPWNYQTTLKNLEIQNSQPAATSANDGVALQARAGPVAA